MPKFLPVEGAPDHVKVGTFSVPVTFGKRRSEGLISFRASVGSHGQKVYACGTNDVKEAVQRAETIIEFLIKHQEAPRDPLEFSTFAKAFYDQKLPTWRKNTQKSARNQIENFLVPYFRGRHIADITDQHWGRFVGEILTLFPERDLRNARKYMRMILKSARDAGFATKTLKLEIPPSAGSPGIWVPRATVESFVASEKTTERLHLQIMMAYLMAMRKMEILALDFDRIDMTRESLYLGPEHTKIKQAREIAIHPLVIEELRKLKKTAKSKWLFPLKDGREGHIQSNESEWTEVRVAVGVWCRFHDLRHSAICEWLLVQKQAVQDVSTYVGTSIEELQETYLHPTAETTRGLVLSHTLTLPLKLVAGKAEAP